MEITRRRFIEASLSAAGGLALAFHLPGCSRDEPDLFAPDPSIDNEVNAWLTIEPDGTVTIRVARPELGQGVVTALPMIVAEELACRWEDVRYEVADVNRSLRQGGIFRSFNIGGSVSVRSSRPYLQQAGANARERLRRAAAARWEIAPEQCVAREGRIHDEGGGRSLSFGELAAEAARVDLGTEPLPLKQPGEFTLIGKPTRRLDVPAKVDGSVRYGIDVRLPDLRYAAIVHCPVRGGRLASHDAEAVKGRAGIHAVVALEDAVAVVADSWWRAHKAVQEIRVEWDTEGLERVSTAEQASEFVRTLAEPGQVFVEQGDLEAAEAGAAQRIEVDYQLPYLTHACMEPLNCTAHVTRERADLWLGTQNTEAALRLAAKLTGLGTDQVYVHGQPAGGGFGRRTHTRYIEDAVRIAMEVEGPVQLIWSREEDTRHGPCRPMAALRFRATLDSGKRVRSLFSHSVTHSILGTENPKFLINGVDKTSIMGLDDFPYAVGALRFEHTMRQPNVEVGVWRAVGLSQNTFAIESFIDELALAAGKDPLELRRELLADRPAFLRVLDVLADKADWGAALPAGRGRGLAIQHGMGSIVGEVVEVHVTPDGELTVERVVAVVDCGHVVNPLTIEEQIEGGILFGLSAALHGEVAVEAGRVVPGNFDGYPILRLAQTPKIETHLAPSGGEKWGGIGEPGLPPLAPALCNAIHSASGIRVRALPLSQQSLAWQPQPAPENAS